MLLNATVTREEHRCGEPTLLRRALAAGWCVTASDARPFSTFAKRFADASRSGSARVEGG
jgi:hypothetical protein